MRPIVAALTCVSLTAGITLGGVTGDCDDLLTITTPVSLEPCGYYPQEGGGSGTPSTPAAGNNTARLDANRPSSPVIFGSYVLGTRGHLLFENLTDAVPYTLLPASGAALGVLTARAGEVRYYNVDLERYGTWRLFEDAEYRTLGDAAEAVISFTVASSGSGHVDGTYIALLPKIQPPIEDEVVFCDWHVVPGGTQKFNTTDKLYVPSGGGIVAVHLSWVNGYTDTVLEFVLSLSPIDGRRDPKPVVAASLSLGDESTREGNTTVYFRAVDGDRYRVVCEEKYTGTYSDGWVYAHAR